MKKVLLGISLIALVLTLVKVGASVHKSAQETPKVILLEKNNTLILEEEITPVSAAKLQMEAIEMDKHLDKGQPIYLILKTPGGSVVHGELMIETLLTLNHEVKTVTLFAASMGFHTVQGLGERLIIPSGTLMSHRARISGDGITGEIFGNLESRVKNLEDSILIADSVAAKRMGKSLEAYETLIANEYWTTGINAVLEGAADTLVLPKCGDTLSGTHEKLFDLGLFGLKAAVLLSDCPMIAGPLSIKIAFGNETPTDIDSSKDLEDSKKQLIKEALSDPFTFYKITHGKK